MAVDVAAIPAAFGSRSGRVATFDDAVGAGTVVVDGSEETWSFHCTSIADGSRTIPVGIWVTFDIEPGPTGLEAVRVRRRA
jgi:cold shock CspA family protein